MNIVGPHFYIRVFFGWFTLLWLQVHTSLNILSYLLMLTQDIKITFLFFYKCMQVVIKYIPVVLIEHILQISQRSTGQLHSIWHPLPKMDKNIVGNSFRLGIRPYMLEIQQYWLEFLMFDTWYVLVKVYILL